jgi:hypothetical protein
VAREADWRRKVTLKLRAELAAMKLEEGYEVNYVKWNQTNFVDRLYIALRTTVRPFK